MHKLDVFSKDAKLHHIGIAVASIKEIDPMIEIIADPAQKVRVGFISLNGVDLELVEPDSVDSPVSESIKKGIKILHICYAVDDIEKTLQKCRDCGFHSIGYHTTARPIEAKAFNGKIAWVYSKEYGLFELLERKK